MNKSSYHHGDLRNTLISSAIDMLVAEGIESLSLRELAKRVGVSHNAPYQHFADKESLIAAIAERGFFQLGQAIASVNAETQQADPQTRLIAACSCYVQFMVENPSYLHVMFGSFPHTRYPTLAKTSGETLDKLVEIIVQAQAEDRIIVGDPKEIAGVFWMAVHGLSSVIVAQKLPTEIIGQRNPIELAGVFIQMICQGVVKK